jgi:hypothetical protein
LHSGNTAPELPTRASGRSPLPGRDPKRCFALDGAASPSAAPGPDGGDVVKKILGSVSASPSA